ncbi:MAG: chromosomal replication initiator protein DnaA [Bacteroidota bacterium]|jgi:chromosomal replication initiator protein
MAKTFEQVWESCLKIFRDNINHQSFKTWFEPIRPIALEDNVLTIEVPSQFFYEWLEEHYVDIIGKTIKRELGKEAKLQYQVLIENQNKVNPASIKLPGALRTAAVENVLTTDYGFRGDGPAVKNPFAIPGLKRSQIDPQLNPNYTFDAYIEGECNRLCRSAGLAISEKPGGTSFNPLVIYGGAGVGKTHLMHAIGNQVKQNFPNKTVLYVSADKFINQFIEHSKNNEINDFINFYQLIDVLMIDDIQYFAPAIKSQDAFFAIFNHLHQNGKQIVLTSDKPPKDLEGVQERLLGRFKWGLVADLNAPDFETRMAILEYKMRQDGVELPMEVVKYLAYNVQNNIREMEGALTSLLAHSTLVKRDIDLDLTKKVLRNIIKTSNKEITIDAIQKMVCDYYNISYEKLQAKTRKREIVQARQISMFLAKKFTKNSLKTIGEHFGGRDHTTVIHSCQTVNDLMDTDTTIRGQVKELQQKVQLASM